MTALALIAGGAAAVVLVGVWLRPRRDERLYLLGREHAFADLAVARRTLGDDTPAGDLLDFVALLDEDPRP